METEKLYSPLEFYIHNPREEERNGEYRMYDIYDEQYKISHYDVMGYMDAIELAFRRDRDSLDKNTGMAEYLNKPLADKVKAVFPDIECHNNSLWCVTEITLNAPLTPDEMASLKDWWSGQLSDGWGEGFEQHEVKVGNGDELYIVPWSSGNDFFIDTESEFAKRFGLEYLIPTNEVSAEEAAELPLMELKLYSPVFCSCWPLINIEHDDPDELTKQGIVDCSSEIRAAILSERLPREAERGYMTYYDTPDSINEKVKSLFVDVEIHNGQLWAVATANATEPLTADEIDLLKDYLSNDVYSDTLGDRLEGKYIRLDADEIAINLWRNNGEYFINTQTEFALRTKLDYITPSPAEPPLTPAQMALFEPGFDEDDHVDTGASMTSLIDRVNANFAEYIDSFFSKEDDEIVDFSAEIANVAEAHHYITAVHNFHYSEMQYLLEFTNPLRVVAEAFSGNRDEVHSDIMWKIFHEQDALKNGRHELVSNTLDEFGNDKNALKQELFCRLDKNISDFYDEMLNADKNYIYTNAENIVARYTARSYMKDGYDYKTGEVEYLLQFQDPLSLVAENLPALHELGSIPEIIGDILEDKDSHGQYEKVIDAANPASKESARKPPDGEKPSVLEQIREAARMPSEPRKEKNNKKTEPEH